jgi:hypothetical protein
MSTKYPKAATVISSNADLFSFAKDGPLDMRMCKQGASAFDLVNNIPKDRLEKINLKNQILLYFIYCLV